METARERAGGVEEHRVGTRHFRRATKIADAQAAPTHNTRQVGSTTPWHLLLRRFQWGAEARKNHHTTSQHHATSQRNNFVHKTMPSHHITTPHFSSQPTTKAQKGCEPCRLKTGQAETNHFSKNVLCALRTLNHFEIFLYQFGSNQECLDWESAYLGVLPPRYLATELASQAESRNFCRPCSSAEDKAAWEGMRRE